MLELVWIVATVTAQGALATEVPESARFKDMAQCQLYGEHMAGRTADWVRGRINADWSHPVEVRFRCRAGGNRV